MKLEIDDDFADEIVQQVLIDTYVDLTRDLKIYKKNENHLHEEDAAAYADVVEAVKVLAAWFFVPGQFEELVKKAKKK